MVEETQSSNRNLIIVLAIAALLLAFAVVAVIVFVVLGGGESGAGATTESAKLMPADTFMFMAFNPHLDQAENFEVLDRAWGDNPQIQEGLADMLESLKEEGMDYEADIEPWLGDEIGFSLDSSFLTAMDDAFGETFGQIEESLSGGDVETPQMDAQTDVPQFTVAVATTDVAASESFLDKLRTKAEEEGETFQETEYQGIQIVYQESEMAYAIVDNYVILTAGGLEPMQQLIDAQEDDSLAENEIYKDVLARLPSDQIGYAFIDVGAYMDVLVEAMEPAMADLPPELLNLDQVEAIKGAGFSVGLESDGVRVDFVSTYDPEALPEDMPSAQASPGKTVERVPDSTLFYMSSIGLGQGLQNVLDAVKAMPDTAEDFDEQMQMLTGMLGVSMDELVEMLSGEFAVAVTHDPAGIAGDPSVPVGASFVIEAQEEEKFERLLRSLSSLLAMAGEIELSEQTINDVTVSTIPDPSTGNMVVGWGVGQSYFAIGTSQELLEAAFGGDVSALSDNATFKAATSRLPDENTGLFYLNMEGILEIATEEMSPSEREAGALLNPLKAISAASEPFDEDRGYTSGLLFLLIENE